MPEIDKQQQQQHKKLETRKTAVPVAASNKALAKADEQWYTITRRHPVVCTGIRDIWPPYLARADAGETKGAMMTSTHTGITRDELRRITGDIADRICDQGDAEPGETEDTRRAARPLLAISTDVWCHLQARADEENSTPEAIAGDILERNV